ncbi:hypothetical protein HDU91_006307 [Kappamyces sp. JEL0680]|nr:hypothetical protein HDU91_006307 [Kappamyces sp. JEL0680]
MYASHAPPPLPSSNLQDIIATFGELDLHKDDDCFASWLAQKQHQRQPKPPKIAPAPTLSPSAAPLESLSNEQVDLLIKKLLKNQGAYQKWLLLKQDKERKQATLLEKKKKQEDEAAERERKKKEERDRTIAKNIQAWQAKKKKQLEVEEQRDRERAEREKRLKMERELANQRAFQAWQESHSKELLEIKEKIELLERKGRPARPLWVKDPPRSVWEEESRAKDVVLSPPNLYNDYETTKKYCGESYFRKYGLLVASAGHQPGPAIARQLKRKSAAPPRPATGSSKASAAGLGRKRK